MGDYLYYYVILYLEHDYLKIGFCLSFSSSAPAIYRNAHVAQTNADRERMSWEPIPPSNSQEITADPSQLFPAQGTCHSY